MTADELTTFIAQSSVEEVLAYFEKLSPKDRRTHKAAILAQFKKAISWANGMRSRNLPLDPYFVAFYAVASLTDLKKSGDLLRTDNGIECDIFRRLKPDWLADYVSYILDTEDYIPSWLPQIWRSGLIPRPTHESLIVEYYRVQGKNPSQALDQETEKEFLNGDVWRFFEIGGGYFCLSKFDHHNRKWGKGVNWIDRFHAYIDAGNLDRQRLMDASLDALDRDFQPMIAGWYSRFFVTLSPTLDEQNVRIERYLGLISSAVPTTVNFALQQLLDLEKAGLLKAQELIPALAPALTARGKGTVTQAMRLLQSTVKRAPDVAVDASIALSAALITDDTGLQTKIVAALEMFGVLDQREVQKSLAACLPLMAASSRLKLVALTGLEDNDGALEMEAAPLVATPIEPLPSAAATFEAVLKLLENPRDPFEIERAFDGLSRFGADLRQMGDAASPMIKRGAQLLARRDINDRLDHIGILSSLIHTATSVVGATDLADWLKLIEEDVADWIGDTTLPRAVYARSKEMLDRVAKGKSVPMMSLPDSSAGTITVKTLLDRMAKYEAADVTVGDVDMAFALMRLPKDARANVPTVPAKTEAGRALAYALGQSTEVGTSPILWSAAWRARVPMVTDKKVASLFSENLKDLAPPVPFCGTASSVAFNPKFRRSEFTDPNRPSEIHMIKEFEANVTPSANTRMLQLPGVFALSTAYNRGLFPCGEKFEDIAWASLLHPADQSLFFRIAVLVLYGSKLSDHPHRAFLEPFFMPGPHLDPFGARLLVYALAVDDKSIVAMAQDAVLTNIMAGRITAMEFASAFKEMLHSCGLKTSRWTKEFKAIAAAGASAFVIDVIEDALTFETAQTPKDMGGMIELYYELCVFRGSGPTRADTQNCLRNIPGGGKIAKFSKKILALG